MNRFIAPILFGSILLVCAIFIVVFQKMNPEMVSTDGATDSMVLDTNPGAGSGMMAAMQMMFNDMTGKTVLTPRIDIAGMEPAAPRGWFPTPYQTVDGEEITNTTLSRGPIVKDSTNTLLTRFDDAARGRGNAITVTYKRGEQLIAFMMRVPDQLNQNTVRGGMVAMIAQNMRGATDFDGRSGPFALHHGVPIEEGRGYVSSPSSNDNVPVDFRVFTADVSGLFLITVLTNSSDAAVAAVLKGIPMGQLIGMLPEPEPHLLISAEFQTRDAEPSKIVPGPSIARRGYIMKKVRLDYTDTDLSLLNSIIKRDIRSWDDAFERYGTGIGISPDILALLGPLPALRTDLQIEYTARALRKTSRVWTDEEDDILEGMSRRRIVDGDTLVRYIDDNPILSEEVIALINLLPQEFTETELPASDTTARVMVIRRGTKMAQGENTSSSCKIENGVRRCIIGGK